MTAANLTMTADEFEKLPAKKQLTVLYRHIVEDRKLNELHNKRSQTSAWLIRGLIASDAALWCIVVFIITRMVG